MNLTEQDYQQIKEDVIDASKAYQDANKVEKFSSHIDTKLSNFNPTIMVYGVYNAGKSTLLNAIFGKNEMAKTGDAPETAEVKAYSYNGYTIYDTPGINAPIEHQQITDEHLSKSELIIFVLSNNGSFEERYIYEKIGEIIKAKKPILIAINNKTGIDMNSNEAISEIEKVNLHLSTICDQMGIDRAEEKVSIAFVDAKTALEGKLENEQELIDESKIEEFEKMMKYLLGKAGKDEVRNALNLYIIEYINDTVAIIDNQIDNPEIRKTQEMITYLEKFKQRTYVELKNMAIQSVGVATANLLQLILAGDEKSIQEMIKKIVEDISQKINQRIKEIQSELQIKLDTFKIEFEDFSTDAPNVNVDIEEAMDSQVATSKGNYNADIALTGSTLATLVPPTLVIPTPIGPIPVKPLIIFAITLYNIFSSSNAARAEAEAKLEQKRALHLAAKNKADEFGITFKDNLLQNVNKNMENTFGILINEFIKFSKQLEKENTKLLEDKNKLLVIASNLEN